jgi:hypothetical protein
MIYTTHTCRGLLRSVLLVLACASTSIGQPPPPGGPPGAAPPPASEPNPPPKDAKLVAEVYTKLVAAKPVDADTLAAKVSDYPVCRLRLYVPPQVGEKGIVGIDHGIFRSTGKVKSITLSGTSAVFRSRLNQLLADPAAASTKNGEAGVRVVDFWCQRPEGATTYVPYLPLLAKVWSNASAADIPAGDTTTPVPGLVCYDDTPEIAECQQAFDYSPPVFKKGMTEVEAPASTVTALAEAIKSHRTQLAAVVTKLAADRMTTKRMPNLGGSLIMLDSTHSLGEEACSHAGTAPRVLTGGESFIGLSPDVKEGTVTLRQKLPFPLGAGILRVPARITSPKATIDVEISKDGENWTRLFLLAADRGGSKWEADASYPLPKSFRGSAKFQIRARLSSTDEKTAGLDRAGGPRFLDAVTRLPRTTELRVDDGLLRTVSCKDQAAAAAKPFSLLIQPERLDVQALSELLQAREAESDVYAPCDLDEAACSAIAKHDGTLRFWSPDEWQQHPPAWLSAMAGGAGHLVFAGLEQPAPELASALAPGKKALSFPLATAPDIELLKILATCTTPLSLDGIVDVSAEQAGALNAYAGPKLSLAAARAATTSDPPGAALAAAVVASSGTFTIGGAAAPDAATLAILAGGQKHLVFDGLEALDAGAAKTLAASGNGLALTGLVSLPRDAADALLGYQGPLLSLPKLKHVTCSVEGLYPANQKPVVRLAAAVRQAALEVGDDAKAQAAAAVKELDAILAEAVDRGLCSAKDKERIARGVEAATTSPAAIVDRVREALPLLSPDTRLGMRTGLPLTAFVDAPGVFVLESPSTARKGVPDKAFFETLAQGRKHLDLSSLTSLDTDMATVLATTEGILSLDGLTSITPEALTALAAYKGPFLSLNGLKVPQTADDLTKLTAALKPIFEMVREDRASAGGLYAINISGMRDYVLEATDSLPEKPKKAAKQLQANSGSRDWASQAGQRVKGKVLALLGPDVIIETPFGPSDATSIGSFVPLSKKPLMMLQEVGAQLAPLRTKAKFAAESGQADAGAATPAGN